MVNLGLYLELNIDLRLETSRVRVIHRFPVNKRH